MAGRAQFPLEQSTGGEFKRQEDAFRSWVTADGRSGYPASPGRYHLYVSWACPWAYSPWRNAAAACWRSSSSMLSAWSASSKALRISRRSREACCLAPSPLRRPRERFESPSRSVWRLCSALLYCS